MTIEAAIRGLDFKALKKAPVGTSVKSPDQSAGTSTSWKTLSIATTGLVLSFFQGSFLPALSVGFTVLAAVPSFQRAAQTLTQERRLNVDFLDSLAISVSTLRGNFFTTAFMTWLIVIGDWIRDQTAAKSRQAIQELNALKKKPAWVVRNGIKVSVRVEEIVGGDIVIAYDGDLIPVDGRVISGNAVVDQRAITGESMPVPKRRNQKVFGASVVREGKLYVRADRPAAESLVAQIVKAVESAPIGETRMQNYAEKFADRLVTPSLGLSALLYLLTRDPNRALSALIVDFGTGIRVAAPTSVLASLSAAARRGVLIRGGNVVERLAGVDSIVFDKTGTLTLGAPKITEVITYQQRSFSSRKVLEVAAAAEVRLKHPVALATVAKARQLRITIPPRGDSKYRIGLGVEASVNGYHVHVGSERFLRGVDININRALGDCREVHRNGQSSLMVAVNGELIGQLVYEDEMRPESTRTIRDLMQRQITELVMLTGDNEAAARRVAGRVGIDHLYAEVLPNEKAEVVKHLRDQGRRVAMVGDGINDALALTNADVGIAMKNGSDLVQHSADVILLHDDLTKLVTAIDIARGAVGLIRQNYSIVVGLNVAALAMALLGGRVSAGLVALVSNGSAIAASVNGLRPLIG